MTPDMTRLMHLIQTKTPGASNAGIKAELYEAIDEFFRDSSAWIEWCNVLTVNNTTSYAVTVTDGQPLRLAGVLDTNSMPVSATMPVVGTIILRDPPTGNLTYKAAIVKKLALPLDSDNLPIIPDFLLQLYSHVILDGVLGKLYSSPNKSYTTPDMATYHLKRFRDGIAQARVDTMRANAFGTQNWTYPQGFKVRTQKSGVSVGSVMGF